MKTKNTDEALRSYDPNDHPEHWEQKRLGDLKPGTRCKLDPQDLRALKLVARKEIHDAMTEYTLEDPENREQHTFLGSKIVWVVSEARVILEDEVHRLFCFTFGTRAVMPLTHVQALRLREYYEGVYGNMPKPGQGAMKPCAGSE